MPVVGTAGHVDHGKSTLIAALTGIEPDRWEEERRRGLTIDLGFAWMRLPDGRNVSFVDVPGHERFIKNMLAGIEAIDAALFLVAASEGWMPQSEEHLAVLDLLEVQRGVVALTKVDLVDEELADLVEMDVLEQMSGTGAAGWPVVRVAALEGSGLGQIAERLAEALVDHSPEDLGRPRLWIDRSFSIRGAGTVVTGTLLEGGLAVGDRVEIWPGLATARIRGLESHGTAVERVGPGWRVAVNLVGLGRHSPDRGSVLTAPGQWRSTEAFLAAVRPARYVKELSAKGAYHMHAGSGAWPVRFTPLEKGPGSMVAYLEPAVPLRLAMGDRFVLRETGRRMVVGGGRVIDPAPPRSFTKRRKTGKRLEGLVAASPGEQADGLLGERGREDLAVLAAHTRGGAPSEGITALGVAVSPHAVEWMTRRLEDLVGRHHRRHPYQVGIPAARAASELGVEQAILVELTGMHPRLQLDGTAIRDPGSALDPDPCGAPDWIRAQRRLAEGGLLPPPPTALGLEEDLTHALVRVGELVRISSSIFYLPGQVEELLEVASGLAQPFTVSTFRAAAGLSRKFAVPFLEWTDSQGKTRRRGDDRCVVR
jgi:selenocysteine-specific elongation factor